VNAELKTWLPMLVFVPLMALMLYRRSRRTFGRQKLEKNRLIFRMVLLSVIGLALIATAHTVEGVIAGGLGLLLGLGLGVVGLRHTVFETTPEGHFYTPHTYVGLAVTALLLARIASRFFNVYQMQASGTFTQGDFQRSPLTFGIFFLMVGYYGLYYGGVLRQLKGALPAPSAPAASTPATPASDAPASG
jgi:hypothetical protein